MEAEAEVVCSGSDGAVAVPVSCMEGMARCGVTTAEAVRGGGLLDRYLTRINWIVFTLSCLRWVE